MTWWSHCNKLWQFIQNETSQISGVSTSKRNTACLGWCSTSSKYSRISHSGLIQTQTCTQRHCANHDQKNQNGGDTVILSCQILAICCSSCWILYVEGRAYLFPQNDGPLMTFGNGASDVSCICFRSSHTNTQKCGQSSVQSPLKLLQTK